MRVLNSGNWKNWNIAGWITVNDALKAVHWDKERDMKTSQSINLKTTD